MSRKTAKRKSTRTSPPGGASVRTHQVGGADVADYGEAPLTLPHERDEATDPDDSGRSPLQQRVIEQARQDIERGLEDTDCRSDHGEDSSCPPRPKTLRP